MKFSKLLAVILAVCLLGTMMIACNNGGDGEETSGEAASAVTISVTLIVKNGTAEVDNEAVSYTGTNPTLGEIIGNYCAANEYPEAFDEQGLLATIGDLTKGDGKTWSAYYETKGKTEAFDSIKDQVVADGDRIVLQLD